MLSLSPDAAPPGFPAAALLFACGAALTLLTLPLALTLLPKRPNFAGRNTPNSAGLLFLPIILLTSLMAGVGVLPVGGDGVGYLLYSLAAGVVGFADDAWGGAGERGFRGHFGALLRGRVTTGLVKVVALGGGAVVFGVVIFGAGLEALFAAFLLAGSTNLANLLDVRPGRALKFLGVPTLLLLLVAPFGAVLVVAGVVGGAAGLFYSDLKGRIMLGDAGAAVFGAVLGFLVVACGPGPLWVLAGAAILGLTAVAEFSSVSRLIRSVGALRRLDLWGRGGFDGDE